MLNASAAERASFPAADDQVGQAKWIRYAMRQAGVDDIAHLTLETYGRSTQQRVCRLKRFGGVFVIDLGPGSIPMKRVTAADGVRLIDRQPGDRDYRTRATLTWDAERWPVTIETRSLAYFERATETVTPLEPESS